jgi:hypothetical protein
VAQQHRALTDAASSPAERERLNYLTRFLEFPVPYFKSWSLAYSLNHKLEQASELKKQNKADEARALILAEGVPLWLKMAPLVREVLLDYQEIVSTRNDQGQLASMHNKYERLTLYRLRASMKEFLGEMPPETEKLLEEMRRPDAKAAQRVFIPTRPTLLRTGDHLRVFAVAPGCGEVSRLLLHVRTCGAERWNQRPMTLVGRRTFVGELESKDSTMPLLDYYVEAEFQSAGVRSVATAPMEAPARFYTVTLV